MLHRPHGATADALPRGYRFHDARTLCTRCAPACRRDGTLLDYPRRTRSRDDLLDDWAILREQGITYSQFAERVDMSTSALQRALTRARADGDPRAQYSLPALHRMGATA